MTNYNPKNNPSDASDTAVDKAKEVADKTEEKVGDVAAAAKEQAKRTVSQVGEKTKQTVDSRMSDVADEIGSVADAVRQTSSDIGGENQTLSKYGDRLAEQLEGISSYLNEKGVEDVLTDLQDFARRQPVLFLGGAFMLGIMAGRFVRSSGERDNQYEIERYGAQYPATTDYSSSSVYTTPQTSANRYRPGMDQASTTSQNQ